MLESINLRQVLFLDIETVPQYSEYELVPEITKKFWVKKSSSLRDNTQNPEDVYKRAGIYAEFGKIVCISVGILIKEKEEWNLRLKSYCSENEFELLSEFIGMINKIEEKRSLILCAHNGKEFDFPYISRRLLLNSLPLPIAFDNSAKKPWEIQHLDTMELWKFGDYKHYTSLDLLTNIFGVPSPKVEIDGSQVADVFYEEKDLYKIKRYCEDDVIAIAQILLRYMNKPLIKTDAISKV